MVATFDIEARRSPEDAPAYSIAEAAALGGVPESTLRAWVVGRPFPARTGRRWSQPVIRRPKSDPRFLSFTNLVEVHVLAAMRRKHAVSLDAIRKAVRYLHDALEVEYDERGRAVRLFPVLRRADAPRTIVIDPRCAFGRPIVVGTAMPAADVRSRFDAGDSIDELARDYDVTPAWIEDALRATPQAA